MLRTYRIPTLMNLLSQVQKDIEGSSGTIGINLFTGSAPAADSAVKEDFTPVPGISEINDSAPGWTTGIDENGLPSEWSTKVAAFVQGGSNPGAVANGWIVYNVGSDAPVILVNTFDTGIPMENIGDTLNVVVRWSIPAVAVLLPGELV